MYVPMSKPKIKEYILLLWQNLIFKLWEKLLDFARQFFKKTFEEIVTYDNF